MLRALAPVLAAPLAAPLAAAALAACAASAQTTAPQTTAPQTAAPLTAPVKGATGADVGKATLTEGPGGVLIRLELQAGALAPGWHGVHLHEKADCSDTGYKLSGAHVGHGGRQHGLLNPAGPEFGDLPNLHAPAAGAFGAEFFSGGVTLAAAPTDGRAPLLDADGSALIVHASPDDHLTQPIGGAGARVACAALSR